MGGDDDGDGYGDEMEVRIKIQNDLFRKTYCLFLCYSPAVFWVFAQLFKYNFTDKQCSEQKKLGAVISSFL